MTRSRIFLPSAMPSFQFMEQRRRGYGFERLDVYWIAMEHYELAKKIAASLPPESTDDANQYRRAAKSIVRNICEGAGEFRRPEKARFYRMALRSGEECGGIIGMLISDFGERDAFNQADALLTRIIPMLVKLCKAQ
ncbi:MAG TPA: four helix bundle protein [Longimicrobiales bacterium]